MSSDRGHVIAEMNASLLAWIGQALVYATPVLGLVLGLWFPGRLRRGQARRSDVVGFASISFATLSLGAGLSVLALPLDPLEPLAVLAEGFVVLGVVIAIYGIVVLRRRP